jgi:NAD-dependent DNA ligase
MTPFTPVASLSKEQAQAEHLRLGEEIRQHDASYYQADAPTVSDAEYDELRRRYRDLETAFPELASADSLSGKVGAAPSEKFAKIRHAIPMLSLGNVFSDEEARDFLARVARFLGLDDGFRPPNLHRPVGATTEGKVDLDDDARARLVDIYAADVRALRKRLPELDMALWPNFATLAPS